VFGGLPDLTELALLSLWRGGSSQRVLDAAPPEDPRLTGRRRRRLRGLPPLRRAPEPARAGREAARQGGGGCRRARQEPVRCSSLPTRCGSLGLLAIELLEFFFARRKSTSFIKKQEVDLQIDQLVDPTLHIFERTLEQKKRTPHFYESELQAEPENGLQRIALYSPYRS
jgi:hypothetical protein